MPPKKAAVANGDAGETGAKFTWEGPNDTKLLLLTQGRYVKPEEYEQLSTAFPGTTTGSIRNRISALRIKQRNLYEDNGWELPDGSAGHSAKKKKETPSKRGADNEDAREQETPTKKPRKKKAIKTSENESEGAGNGVGVKDEQAEDVI